MSTSTKTPRGRADARRPAPELKITAKNTTRQEAEFLRRHGDKLSRTALRAKWVHSPDEHEDRPGQSLATRDHEVIMRWAADRGAVPATVGPGDEKHPPRRLRFDFPGGASKGLRPVSWDDFFAVFDRRKLVFLFQEHLRNGNQSNFFQFDSPER